MSNKKRNHDAEGDERPNKRPLITVPGQATTVKISVVNDVGHWIPAIATTPGLDLPTNVPLKAYARPHTNTIHGSTTARSENELLLYSSAHPKLDYTAREELSGGADSLLKHYLGIYDPKTGELQLVPTKRVVVRGTLRPAFSPESFDGSSAEEKVPQTRLQARTILGEAFGTKKSQKAIRSLTENAIHNAQKSSQNSAGKAALDPVASAVIESMSQATASMQTREELQALTDEAKPRPRANLRAETPADVYTIDGLVGNDALRLLHVRDWQDAVNSEAAVKSHSRFVAKRMVRVVKTKDVKRLKALRYVHIMYNWYQCLKPGRNGAKKLPPREVMREAMMEEVADTMLEGLRRRFAPDDVLNKWAVDNFSTHICALALIIDGFETETTDLRYDLKLDTKQMSQYYQELGCKIAVPTESECVKWKIDKTKRNSHRIAKLKLPLDFPKSRIPGAQKRQ